MTNVTTRLKNLRKENNLKQWQIAEYLGISQQAYSYYEQNKREFPARHVVRIAELYNVSTDFILGTAPRRVGNFELDEVFVQDISLKDVLLTLEKLNMDNRQALLRFLCHLHGTQEGE